MNARPLFGIGAALLLACGNAPPPAVAPKPAVVSVGTAVPRPEPREAAPAPSADTVESVVAGLRPRFKACYDRALADDPSMSGRVKLHIKIASDGTVARVESRESTLPEPVVHCLEEVVSATEFASPGPRGMLVTLPLSFRPAGEQ